MTLGGFLAALALVVFVPFLFRLYRTAAPLDFVNIDREFLSYRNGKFIAANATVIFSDKRVDRFAPSEFFEFGSPYVAIYICKEKNGQYWLWKLYRPTEENPTLTKLTNTEAQEMLKRKDSLLLELCPKQLRLNLPTVTSESANRPNYWDR
jgi:hypothetical protein